MTAGEGRRWRHAGLVLLAWVVVGLVLAVVFPRDSRERGSGPRTPHRAAIVGPSR